MNYNIFAVLILTVITFSPLPIADIASNLKDKYGERRVVWRILTVISVIIALTVLVFILEFFTKEPSEECYSKKEVLESQKIEVIIDSDIKPVENGTCREAVLKDSAVYEGTIVYTSDKKLDKTYQKVRYYNSFVYKDNEFVYLYDPGKALTNNK